MYRRDKLTSRISQLRQYYSIGGSHNGVLEGSPLLECEAGSLDKWLTDVSKYSNANRVMVEGLRLTKTCRHMFLLLLLQALNFL